MTPSDPYIVKTMNKAHLLCTYFNLKNICSFLYSIKKNVRRSYRSRFLLNKSLRTKSTYLNNNSVLESQLSIDLTDFGVAISEVQLLYFLMNLFLADRWSALSIRIQSAMDERGVLIVKPNKNKNQKNYV